MPTSNHLNDLILSLYRGTRSIPPTRYKQWAFDKLREYIELDAGFWGAGYLTDQIIITSVSLFNLPPEIISSYEMVKDQDQMMGPLLCSPGITLDLYDVVTRDEFVDSEIYRRHSRRYGIEQVLATMYLDETTSLLNGISIYRSDPAARFSLEERHFVQQVIPHLIEAASLNYFQTLMMENTGDRGAMMVCDSAGNLLEVESEAARLLRMEWPEWKGPLLPEPITTRLDGKGERRYTGRNTTAIVQPYAEHFRILLIEHGPLDLLSVRERQVAKALAKGSSYKEVSRDMGISTSTVTNHVNRIYRKLGIRNKTELGQLVERAGMDLVD